MAIKLTKELLTIEPEKVAKELVNNKGEQNITSTQLRKFYNDFLILKNKSDLTRNDIEFREKVLPLIFFSKAKLAYSYGRKNKISKEFVDAMNKMIDSIESKSDFDNFLNYYQALIGYTTYYFELKRQERESESRPKVYVKR